MSNNDQRIDDYIARSADFARPVLKHLRELVHSACPDVKEKIKWSFACFDYKGPMLSMAAFKKHCSFSFWKAVIMQDAKKLIANQQNSMGHLGKIKGLADLPDDKILIKYIKEAVSLNDEGIKLPPRKKTTGTNELLIPDYFTKALSKNKNASKIFEGFNRSHKKEYVQWITEAKTEKTRNKRLAEAIVLMTKGENL